MVSYAIFRSVWVAKGEVPVFATSAMTDAAVCCLWHRYEICIEARTCFKVDQPIIDARTCPPGDELCYTMMMSSSIIHHCIPLTIMPRPDPSITSASFELPEDVDEDEPTTSFLHVNNQPQPSRSPYHLPPGEKLRGVANRIIFSRYYVLFYFVMMSLSMVTVILSLMARRKCISSESGM